MLHLMKHTQHALLVLATGLCLFAGEVAWSGVIHERESQRPLSPELGVEKLLDTPSLSESQPDTTPLMVTQALSRGLWVKACSLATSALARQQPDVEALGVFALCAAVRNDKEAASSALNRLREVETPPYYALLAQGILDLRSKQYDKADVAFKTVLQPRSGDPLALFFSGELLHARGKDAEAISSFRSVLQRWPDHAPALAAAARLLAAPKASRAALQTAIAMTERATSVEPMNSRYWQLLVELYERTGQQARANAITLQRLNPLRVK